MEVMNGTRNIIRKAKGLFRRRNIGELQPKDVLRKVFDEMERRKKYGIEEKAFAPNVYVVYLNSYDYEEISPLLTGIKEQLKNKVMERVKRKGYKILSSSVNIDIREDSGLLRNQVVLESSFLKEKTPIELFADALPSPGKNEGTTGGFKKSTAQNEGSKPVKPALFLHGGPKKDTFSNAPATEGVPDSWAILREASPKKGFTKIVEDRKTRFIDDSKVRLEIIEGEDRGDIISLQEGEYTFGRGRDAQLLIKDLDETVSKIHFRITVRNGRIRIQDLGSLNGTKVNHIEIEEAELRKGDMISAGKVLLKVA